MKPFPSLALAVALAVPALAQEATTGAVAETNKPVATDTPASGQSFAASAATLTAPLALTNDYIYLTGDQQEVAGGGKAVFNFTVASAGNYVIETMANAPDEASNSFYVNVDGAPTDPDMIWDIDVTTGFEKRVVSWRGNGDPNTDQFTPKIFKLEPGAHTLVIVGREPGACLKSLTIRPAPPQ